MFRRDCTIAGFDPELARAIDSERGRQEDHVELIASPQRALRARLCLPTWQT